MIDVVVINKSADTSDVHLILDNLTLSGNVYKIYYVADRCSEDFISALYSFQDERLEIIVADYEYKGRRTSSLRNMGYIRAKEDFDNINGVMFVDGDRYFVEGSSDAIDEGVVNNVLLDSVRDYDDNFLHLMGTQIVNMFYSACVYLPKDVSMKLEKHTYKGLLWNEDIESLWGIEDLFMGNQLNILGIPVYYNRNIRLNNAEITRNSCERDILINANRLMKAVFEYKKHLMANQGTGEFTWGEIQES